MHTCGLNGHVFHSDECAAGHLNASVRVNNSDICTCKRAFVVLKFPLWRVVHFSVHPRRKLWSTSYTATINSKESLSLPRIQLFATPRNSMPWKPSSCSLQDQRYDADDDVLA
jgi:hypothetical protein